MNRSVVLIPALLLSACASAWQPSSSPGASVDSGAAVQVDTPVGWYRIDEMTPEAIVLTKNGISIETITILRAPLGRKLPNSPKRFQDGLTPEAAADVDISNHEFAPGIDGFKILDRGTATIDGHACYQYTYSYLESFGQPRMVKDYGCIVAPYVYRFHYTAPAETWFPQFLPTFDALVASARIPAQATPDP